VIDKQFRTLDNGMVSASHNNIPGGTLLNLNTNPKINGFFEGEELPGMYDHK
jgi:hypothetical protein